MLLFSDGIKDGWRYLALFLLAVLVFSNTLFFEFAWDDNLLLVGQAAYQSVNLKRLLFEPVNGLEYLPLRDLTYIIDYQVWGWNPRGFHFTNLLLYVLNVWAVYRLTIALNSAFFALEREDNKDAAVSVAFVTAALFAAHPLHSEVVSYIHCRNVLLSGLFFFLSVRFFLEFLRNGRRRDNIISFVCFILSLLSKATVIILPLILLTLVYFRRERTFNHYLPVIPFIAVSALFFFVFKFHADESGIRHEHLIMFFGGQDLHPKIATALQIPFFYLSKLIVPAGLSTEYANRFSNQLFSIQATVAFLVLAGSLLTARLFKNKFPQAWFAILWFLICLVPVSNIFMTNPVVADRYVYLSSYAFAFFTAVLFQKLQGKLGLKITSMMLVLVLGSYAGLSYQRNQVWRSEVSVFENMTTPHSNQAKGYSGLGHYYFDRKQYAKSLEYFRRAKQISPEFSEFEYFQARLAFMEHKPGEALNVLHTALENQVLINEPVYWGLSGEIHESLGSYALAIQSFQKALESPYATNSTREYASGKLENLKGKLALSLDVARKDLLAHPGDLNRKAQFALKLQSAGFRAEAIEVYEDLVTAGGDKWQIHYNLGLLYKQQNQIEKSINHFLVSLSLNNTSGMIHNELGILYKKTGQYTEAVGHFTRAIGLEPESVKPRVNLATLYFQQGEAQEARKMFEQILNNFPEYETMARYYLLKIPN